MPGAAVVRVVKRRRYPIQDPIATIPLIIRSPLISVRGGRGFGLDPLVPGVRVKLGTAQESDEGYTEFPCYVHRQAARRGDRAHDGYPGHEALLHDLEAAATADHDDVVAQGQPSLQECPADELVCGVVAAHVLLEGDEVAFCIEERRRVQPSCRLEESLRPSELLRQGVDGLWGDHWSRRDHGAAAQLELLQARLAAD